MKFSHVTAAEEADERQPLLALRSAAATAAGAGRTPDSGHSTTRGSIIALIISMQHTQHIHFRHQHMSREESPSTSISYFHLILPSQTPSPARRQSPSRTNMLPSPRHPSSCAVALSVHLVHCLLRKEKAANEVDASSSSPCAPEVVYSTTK